MNAPLQFAAALFLLLAGCADSPGMTVQQCQDLWSTFEGKYCAEGADPADAKLAAELLERIGGSCSEAIDDDKRTRLANCVGSLAKRAKSHDDVASTPDLWGPFDPSNIDSILVVSGRTASEADVLAGRAVFFVAAGGSTAFQLALPQRAVLVADGAETAVVAVQAETANGQDLIGYRLPAGGNGIASFAEFRMSIPPP